MHVELIYAPGCNSVNRTREVLETIIAEERLPIPVEVRKDRRRESQGQGINNLTITVDGVDVNDLHEGINCERCRMYRERTGLMRTLCMEHLREVLWRKWQELTEHPLMAARRSNT